MPAKDWSTEEYNAPPVEFFYFNSSPAEPTAWIVENVVPAEACVIVGAEEKTGKTWLCLEMAIALATGGQAFGEWQCCVEPAKTLLVSPEGTRKGLQRRLYGLCHAKGLNPDTVGPMLPVWPGRIDLREPDDIDAMHVALRHLRPALLVIDPLVSATAGDSENDAGAMQEALNIIRDMLEESPGMAIVVCHHLGKGHADKSAWHALRGSSALGAWADGLISIRRMANEADATRRIDVWHRDDESPTPIGFDIVAVPIPEVEAIKSVELRPCIAPTDSKGKVPGAIKAERLAALEQMLADAGEDGLEIDEVAVGLGVSASTVKHWLPLPNIKRWKGKLFCTV